MFDESLELNRFIPTKKNCPEYNEYNLCVLEFSM